MPIITAQQLRDVLGVSDSLYTDVYLEQIIASAEEVILPMLTQYQSSVASYSISNGVIYLTTIRPNYFVVGQDVVITGCGAIDDTYTVTEDRIAPFVFSVATIAADNILTPIIPAGRATLDGGSAYEIYGNVAPIQSAILVVSVEIFQSVTAPGNMTTNEGFNPSPFVLGRSLQNRVISLLNPFLDVETICQ
jgi:hypothetical protein